MRQAVPDFSDLIGIPFVNGGRDIKEGLDCWGLFMVVMERFGIRVPDYKISCFDTERIYSAAEDALGSQWKEVKKPDSGVGVVFAIDPKRPDIIQHFGICINKFKFIHTLEKSGSIITNLNDGYWSKKIKGFYKWQ